MQVSGKNFFPLSTMVTTTVGTQRSFQLTFSTSYKHGLASGASSVMDTSSSWNFELKNGFSASVNRQSAADHNVAARLKMHVWKKDRISILFFPPTEQMPSSPLGYLM